MGIFSHHRAVIVVSQDKVQGIITHIDMLDFLATRMGSDEA
jgi:predicted transcriptional regulator